MYTYPMLSIFFISNTSQQHPVVVPSKCHWPYMAVPAVKCCSNHGAPISLLEDRSVMPSLCYSFYSHCYLFILLSRVDDCRIPVSLTDSMLVSAVKLTQASSDCKSTYNLRSEQSAHIKCIQK